jgi:hypothetical protein
MWSALVVMSRLALVVPATWPEFSTGGLRVTGFSSATGNVIGGNVSTAGLITATGNVTGGNILTAGMEPWQQSLVQCAYMVTLLPLTCTAGNILTATDQLLHNIGSQRDWRNTLAQQA